MVTTAAFPEQLIAVYEGVLLGLDLFDADAAAQRSIHAGPVRLDVLRIGAHEVMIEGLCTHPLARGRGCGSAGLRGACDFADQAGWLLVTDPQAVHGSPERAARLFGRFGFGPALADPSVLVRPAGPGMQILTGQ